MTRVGDSVSRPATRPPAFRGRQGVKAWTRYLSAIAEQTKFLRRNLQIFLKKLAAPPPPVSAAHPCRAARCRRIASTRQTAPLASPAIIASPQHPGPPHPAPRNTVDHRRESPECRDGIEQSPKRSDSDTLSSTASDGLWRRVRFDLSCGIRWRRFDVEYSALPGRTEIPHPHRLQLLYVSSCDDRSRRTDDRRALRQAARADVETKQVLRGKAKRSSGHPLGPHLCLTLDQR